MMHNKNFGKRNIITVYITYDYHFGSPEKIVTFRVNWGCCGAVTVEDAEEFNISMGEAVAYANHFKFIHAKAIKNGKTHKEWMQENFPYLFE